MKNLLFIILSSIIFASPALANVQLIDKKYFKTPNKPIFQSSGYVNFSAAGRNQASSYDRSILPDGFSTNHNDNKGSIGNDTQLFFKSGIMSDNKTIYGATAKIEFNYNTDRRNESPNLDQIFLYSQNNYGRFEIGHNQAVNQKMKTGPADFARGSGGINGKYLTQISMPMLANSSLSSSPVCSGTVGSTSCQNVKLPRFILLAQSPIGHGGYSKSFYRRGADNQYPSTSPEYSAYMRHNFRAIKDDSFDGVEDAQKISYFSPRFEGLQLGFSYAPNSDRDGLTVETTKTVDLFRTENILSFGLNYEEYFDNLEVELSATAEKGNVKNSKSSGGISRNDLFSYDLGATISYFGFSVGASYGSWGKSFQPKSGIYSCDYNSSQTLAEQNCTSNAKSFSGSHYYTLGIAYQFGPFAASITNLKSTFQKNEFEATSLGLDYKLTKDLMPYFELTKFAFNINQVTASDVINQNSIANSERQLRNNQGYVILTGILYSF